MGKLNFVSLVLLLVFGFLVMGAGTPAVYAGGEKETIEPVDEEVVITSDSSQTNVLWFVLGFLAAVLITIL